jgi:hypothetical protein
LLTWRLAAGAAQLGHERLDHRHEPVLGELGHRASRGLEGRDRARVVEVDAGEHLAALEPAPAISSAS